MITLLKISLITFISIIGIFYTMFALYSFNNFSTLRLGFAEKPATKFDLVIIGIVPILLFLLDYTIYDKFFN